MLEKSGVHCTERFKPSAAASPDPNEVQFSKISSILDEAKNGRMVILVDDGRPGNHGDLVIPAQMATPQAVNFMATHARGLVCLALTQQRVNQLGLPLMVEHNNSRCHAPFTVSVEARTGVTTGISAADRARTIAVAIDTSLDAAEIVTPGHVFPLVSRDGGVLVRAGLAEAAVDIARLSGLNPSATICKIMNDDGSVAQMPELSLFAEKHDLKIGTVKDLIAYRREHDNLVERRAELVFRSRWGGEWTAMTFYNKATGAEQIALMKGGISSDAPTLVRMHLLSTFPDLFAEDSERSFFLQRAMEIISREGAGVIVVMTTTTPDVFTRALEAKAASEPQVDELRDYGVGAQILTDLGVKDMILLTNNDTPVVALDGFGLRISGKRPLDDRYYSDLSREAEKPAAKDNACAV